MYIAELSGPAVAKYFENRYITIDFHQQSLYEAMMGWWEGVLNTPHAARFSLTPQHLVYESDTGRTIVYVYRQDSDVLQPAIRAEVNIQNVGTHHSKLSHWQIGRVLAELDRIADDPDLAPWVEYVEYFRPGLADREELKAQYLANMWNEPEPEVPDYSAR